MKRLWVAIISNILLFASLYFYGASNNDNGFFFYISIAVLTIVFVITGLIVLANVFLRGILNGGLAYYIMIFCLSAPIIILMNNRLSGMIWQFKIVVLSNLVIGVSLLITILTRRKIIDN